MEKTHSDGKMSFTPEEVADGKLHNFVNVLIDLKAEINIWTDGYCMVVEYIEPDSQSRRTKSFQVVDEENGDYVGNYYEDETEDIE